MKAQEASGPSALHEKVESNNLLFYQIAAMGKSKRKTRRLTSQL